MSVRPRRTLLSLLALVLLGLPRAAAADRWPVERGPSHEPVPFRYDPGLVKNLPRSFLEDAPACTLYSGVSYLMEADGTVETITHEILRFNGRKGIDKLGEYRSITYDPAYEKLTLNEARVLKADGRHVAIEPRNVQLRDISTDYQVYDHEKQLIISFPDLEVGDAIEVKWTTRGKNPEYQGRFFTRYTFGDDSYPVALDELRFRLPKSLTLKYAAVNGKLEPEVREDGKYRLYHWRVANRRALPQDDNLPSKEELRLQVVLSTFASWDEVARWKNKLRNDCWKCTPEIGRVVEEVTRGLKTPEEKARALTYWVRRHVRYVSVGVTHDYKPHAPASVLASRYGDCKDQAQLLAVMLRRAGLPVGLVTLGTLDDGQIVPQVPSPWGSHAILLTTINGRQHWIDTTVSLAPWDYLPRDDRDRLAYVVDDQGLKLLRTPPLTAGENRVEQTTLVTVDANGTSHNRRRIEYYGVQAVAQREAWTEVPPGERRRLMASDLQDSNSRSRLRRLAVDEKRLKDPDRPVVARLNFEVPGQFSGDGELEGSLTDSKVWNRLLSFTLDYDREAALDLGSPFESFHRYVVRLPVALRFETLPKDLRVASKWGFFQVTVRQDDKDPRRFALEFHLRIDQVRVEPADFDLFRKFHGEVAKSWRAWLTLKPTEDLADAPLLEMLQALAPDDEASARILAGLYCSHGKYDRARGVLAWARFLHPKDSKLWELTVKAAASLKEEEAAYQEMVRRFPLELRYGVALGATRLKRGKFAEARAVLEPLAGKAPAAVAASADYQLARCDWLQEKTSQALKHWEAAAKLDPESVHTIGALRFKGKVCEKLGRLEDARKAYREALSVDPGAEEALRALVRLELAAGHKAEALVYLRRYTVAVGDDVQGLVQAADFHLRLGRLDDALDLANRALAVRFDLDAQRIAGLVHARRGEWEKAVTLLARADKTPEVRENLIRGYLGLGRLRDAFGEVKDHSKDPTTTPGLEKACALVRTLMERRGSILRTLKGLTSERGAAEAVDGLVCAEHAQESGAPEATVSLLLRLAFASKAEIGPAYSLRGLLCLEKGRLSAALADAEKALALSPEDPRAYYVRGRVRYEREAKGALADLTRAAELTKRKDPLILQALAAALYHANRRQEALAVQREAVKLRPEDDDLRAKLREWERTDNKGQGG